MSTPAHHLLMRTLPVVLSRQLAESSLRPSRPPVPSSSPLFPLSYSPAREKVSCAGTPAWLGVSSSPETSLFPYPGASPIAVAHGDPLDTGSPLPHRGCHTSREPPASPQVSHRPPLAGAVLFALVVCGCRCSRILSSRDFWNQGWSDREADVWETRRRRSRLVSGSVPP